MSRLPFSVLREAYSRMGVSHRPSVARLARIGLLGVPDSGSRIAASMREAFAELVSEVWIERLRADPWLCAICKRRHANACPALWGGSPEAAPPWPDCAVGADERPMKIGQRVSDMEDGAIGVLRMIHGRDKDPIVTVRMPDGFGRSKAASGFIGT